MIPCRIAVLYADFKSYASYYDDWLDAFMTSKRFSCASFNIVHGGERRKLSKNITDFDAIVLLHSVTGNSLAYAKACVPILQKRKGVLFSFVGNEFNMPGAGMADKIAFLKEAGVQIIATQLLKEAGVYLYAGTGAQVISVPHALNTAAFSPVIPLKERSIDIGVRTFRYCAYLGDNERNRLVDWFAQEGPKRNLRMDISTTQRFNRKDWAQFLNSCKGTLATEAGSWWLERDDAIVNHIRDWQNEQKKNSGASGVVISMNSPLRRLAHCLPWGIKQRLIGLLRSGPIRYEAFAASELDFDVVYDKFFRATPKAPVYTKCISSRNFDAVGAKCCQIMFPGRYNDILKADEHYISLKPDFSNVDDVLRRFADPYYRKTIVDLAYEQVMEAHTYPRRIEEVYGALERFSTKRG